MKTKEEIKEEYGRVYEQLQHDEDLSDERFAELEIQLDMLEWVLNETPYSTCGKHNFAVTEIDKDTGEWIEAECLKCGLLKTNS